MTEPRIVVAHREHLWWLLAEAAQLEHVIMWQYLFAGFSLKNGTSEPCAGRRQGLKTQVLEVSRGADVPRIGDHETATFVEPAKRLATCVIRGAPTRSFPAAEVGARDRLVAHGGFSIFGPIPAFPQDRPTAATNCDTRRAGRPPSGPRGVTERAGLRSLSGTTVVTGGEEGT
jgi:hypothetical protein